jgi:hypothetical protein
VLNMYTDKEKEDQLMLELDYRQRLNFSNYAIHVRITRDIKKGEELLINYGSDFNVVPNRVACWFCQLKFTEHDEEEKIIPKTYSAQNWTRQFCTAKDCFNFVHAGCSTKVYLPDGWTCNLHSEVHDQSTNPHLLLSDGDLDQPLIQTDDSEAMTEALIDLRF